MVIPNARLSEEVEAVVQKKKKKKNNTQLNSSYACFPPFPCSVSQEVHSQTPWLSLSVGSYEEDGPLLSGLSLLHLSLPFHELKFLTRQPLLGLTTLTDGSGWGVEVTSPPRPPHHGAYVGLRRGGE